MKTHNLSKERKGKKVIPFETEITIKTLIESDDEITIDKELSIPSKTTQRKTEKEKITEK